MKDEHGLDITWLREGFAAPDGPPDPEACPPPEKIWAAVRGELPPAELREVLDHTAACAACAEDWRLAVAFDEESVKSSPSGTTPLPFRPSPFARFKPYLVAAAAASVLTVVGFRVLNPPTPEIRGGEKTAIHSELREGGVLPSDRTLRWTGVPGAATYDLILSTEDEQTTPYLAEDLETAEYQIPGDVLKGLPSGTRFLWTVEAKGPEGQSIGSPQTFENRLP